MRDTTLEVLLSEKKKIMLEIAMTAFFIISVLVCLFVSVFCYFCLQSDSVIFFGSVCGTCKPESSMH